MALSLNLTGLSSGYPIPGTYIEVLFGQGQAGGDLSAKTVLLMAPSTAAGSIVQDTEVYGPISDEAEVIAKAGAGSPLHRMARAFLSVCKSAQVYLLAPTRSAGVAATVAVALTNNATGAGVAKIEFCEEAVEYAFVAGATPTSIAEGLSDAFNAKTSLPAVAVPTAGSIAITAKVAGPEGNALRLRASITGGIGTTITQTSEAPFASGATAASYTNALATIAAQDFDIIVPHSHSGATADAVLGALMTQVGSQAQPITGIRQKVIAGTALSAANSVTLSQTINQPRLQLVNLEESPLEPSVLGAIAAAVATNTLAVDPASNLDGYGTGGNDVFPVLAPRNRGSWFTETEQSLMLNGGVTPLAMTKSGTPYIVRAVTSKSLDGDSPDYRTRDVHRVWVADAFADDLSARLGTSPWSKITNDPPNDAQPPAAFATPSRVKALVEQLVSDYVDGGYLDPGRKDATLAGIAVGIDPLNNTRMNIRAPIFAANLFHQSASLVAESSAAA